MTCIGHYSMLFMMLTTYYFHDAYWTLGKIVCGIRVCDTCFCHGVIILAVLINHHVIKLFRAAKSFLKHVFNN